MLTSRISYIIGFRAANEERTTALVFVLEKLRRFFPALEILLVEQDEVSKLVLDAELNIQHLFIQNTRLYNRCWAFNFAVNNTTKDYFVFADADVFLGKEDFLTLFNSMEKFEAVTPNRSSIVNVLLSGKANAEFEVLNHRPLYTFAGGLLLMSRTAFEKIGGWDERFEGWGGEDEAMSHVIFNTLIAKSFYLPFYHIDHPRTLVDGKGQEKYQENRALVEEIKTMHDTALDRYIDFLKQNPKGKADSYTKTNDSTASAGLSSAQQSHTPTFVLAVTTYNRFTYLKKCIDSFFETRNPLVNWQLLIADDGSTDETKDYLEELRTNHDAILLQNDRVDVHRQVNTIIKTLSNINFDLCFKCDDDIEFLKKGWDDLYWKTIERTGYEHLIFYDKNWRPHSNLQRPIQQGDLISNCTPEHIQGGFYTLTPKIIEAVGYFDEQQFGRRGVGHMDFSFRCCRTGFNVLANPFDVLGSNDLIRLQGADTYVGSVSSKYKSFFNAKEEIAFKRQLAKAERKYIPYNENFQSINEQTTFAEKSTLLNKKSKSTKYPKADATFYPERGISGFIGFLLKRFYNLSIDLRLFFIPAGIKGLGKILNKVSIDLLNIEE